MYIFLNGLDEVHPFDGKHTSFRFLSSLRSTFPVRVCVSSRPEVEFQSALLSAPTLKLHTLTDADMYQYALDFLVPLGGSLPDNVPHYLEDEQKLKRNTVQKIALKSDGVFLWIAVTVKSLQRSFTHNDD